jgi:hypothetical protein
MVAGGSAGQRSAGGESTKPRKASRDAAAGCVEKPGCRLGRRAPPSGAGASSASRAIRRPAGRDGSTLVPPDDPAGFVAGAMWEKVAAVETEGAARDDDKTVADRRGPESATGRTAGGEVFATVGSEGWR